MGVVELVQIFDKMGSDVAKATGDKQGAVCWRKRGAQKYVFLRSEPKFCVGSSFVQVAGEEHITAKNLFVK